MCRYEFSSFCRCVNFQRIFLSLRVLTSNLNAIGVFILLSSSIQIYLHYACLTPVIIIILLTTSSIEVGGKFRVTSHRKVLWRPKTRKTNCYDWELLVLIGCFKRDNWMKWIEVSISLVQIYQAPALQMEVTLLKLFYMEQPLRRLSVRRGDV